MTTYIQSELFFSDGTSTVIFGISNERLTQDVITDAIMARPIPNFSDVSAVNIGPDIIYLGDFLFTECFNLSKITIFNTDNISFIGLDIFADVASVGTYAFYTANNYKTLNVSNLIRQLPIGWVPEISYNFYTEFVVLTQNLIKINNSTASYYSFAPIDISYADFHTLFFPNNGYFSLNINNYGKNRINPSNLSRYITINSQSERTYIYEDLSSLPLDVSFNLLSTVLNYYQYNIPSQSWSINSTIQINKQLSKLKTIFNFNKICCSSYNTKITIDNFFNMFEAQGIAMATDNSYNTVTSTPVSAIGLPFDAYTTKYTAILTLYLKSSNLNVSDIAFQLPYLINFSNSMPKNDNPNTNNYRYNPYF